MSLKGIRKSDGTAEYIYADDTLSEENAPGEAKAAGDRIAGVEGRVTTLETAAPEIISNATKDWLDDNVTPTGSAVAIDSSLTQSGLAADAKAAGDAVNDLKSDLKEIANITYTKESGYISGNGSISSASASDEKYTSLIPAFAGQSFIFNLQHNTSNMGNWCAYALYDKNETFISRMVFVQNTLGTTISETVTIPQTSANARYIAFTWRNFTTGNESIGITNLNATLSNFNSTLSATKSDIVAPLVLSQRQNFVDVKITDAVATIKIPADTIACLNTGYVQITSNETEVDFSASVIATSAIKLAYNLTTGEFELYPYNTRLNTNVILVASIRRNVSNPSIFIGCSYRLNEKPFGIDIVSNNAFVRSINHRGYYTAPENTLPAYILSKKKGFEYVECDVSFTSDGVPVLLHDATINRTGRNADGSTISDTININDITYEQALQYDFGVYKSSDYEGTKIPTLTQFIELCKNLGLHPYIELKNNATYTAEQIGSLVDIVKSHGMLRHVTWISFSEVYLGYVKNADVSARLGLVCGDITTTIISNATSLKTTTNSVFIDAYFSDAEHPVSNINRCINADIPVEVWTVDTLAALLALDPYITGVTSNNLIASNVLYMDAISQQT